MYHNKQKNNFYCAERKSSFKPPPLNCERTSLTEGSNHEGFDRESEIVRRCKCKRNEIVK